MTTVEMLKHLPPPPVPVRKPPSSVTFSIGKEEFCLELDINDLFLLISFHGDTDMIQRLLHLGADVNAKHKNTGSTALITAAQCGHDSVVETLCNIKGIDKNSRDCRNKSALYYAITMGSPPMIECLCGELADIKGDLLPGLSALELAIACRGDPSIVRILSDYGASRDKNAKTSKTSLKTPHIYNQEKHVGILRLDKCVWVTGNKTKTVRNKQKILKPDHVSRNKRQGKINGGYDSPSWDGRSPVHDYTGLRNVSDSHHGKNNSGQSPVNLPLTDSGKGRPDKGDYAVPEEIGKVSPSDSSEIGVLKVVPTSLSVEGYEEITEESSSNTKKQMDERESGIYYEVPKTEDGSKEEKEKSGRCDFTYINRGPQKVQQQNKKHSPTSNHSPRCRKFIKSPTDVPGVAMSSEPHTTKSQSGTARANERDPSQLQCAQLEEKTVVAETFPEEQVPMRENPGRRGAKAVIGQLPKYVPLSLFVTKQVHKYYSPVQQTIQKATNVGIKSKMNITGGDISSSESSSPCSTYTSSSNGSPRRSHLLDSSSIASLQE